MGLAPYNSKDYQLSIFLVAALCSKLHAQTVLPYTASVDSVFQNLNKSYITTGLLYDRIYPFAALHVFNTSQKDTSSAHHFNQAYYELYQAAYSKTGFLLPDTVDKRE